MAIVASDLSYLTGQKTTRGGRLVTREQIGDIRVFRAYTYPTLHKGFVWRVFSFFTFMCTSIWQVGEGRQARSGDGDLPTLVPSGKRLADRGSQATTVPPSRSATCGRSLPSRWVC